MNLYEAIKTKARKTRGEIDEYLREKSISRVLIRDGPRNGDEFTLLYLFLKRDPFLDCSKGSTFIAAGFRTAASYGGHGSETVKITIIVTGFDQGKWGEKVVILIMKVIMEKKGLEKKGFFSITNDNRKFIFLKTEID